MRTVTFSALLLILAAPAAAGDLRLTVQVPTQSVAEYHRPYAAIWIERDDHSVAAQLAAWYSQKDSKEGAGTKWLPDLRQWWRRGGRSLSMPVDGVSGATRPAGEYKLSFVDGKPPLGKMDAGHYTLVVEAAREVGGREVVRILFDWPATSSRHLSAHGKTELGAISVDLNP